MKYQNVNIEWLGHATFKISDDKITVYFDPFILPPNPKKADLIIISHDHFDHCDPKKVDIIKKPDTTVITNESSAKKLSGNVKIMKPGDIVKEKNVTIQAFPSYNIGKHFHPKGIGLGFVIEIGGVRIYHAGDTDFIPEMSKIKTDIALLPIGGTYTMNEEEAAKAVLTIKPKIAIPMHFGFINGTEGNPNLFKEKIQEQNPNINVIILNPICKSL